MKHILRWVLCVGIFSFSYVTQAFSQDLLFSVQLDKVEYRKKDPIRIEFILKNTGEKAVIINKRFHMGSADMSKMDRDVYLRVVGPNGEPLQIKHSYGTGFPRTDFFSELKPEASASSEHSRDLRASYDFKETGTYVMTGYYENAFGPEIGLNTFQGKLVSGPVEIRIVE